VAPAAAVAAGGTGEALERPWFAAFAVAVLALMLALFVLGERLPTPIVPRRWRSSPPRWRCS